MIFARRNASQRYGQLVAVLHSLAALAAVFVGQAASAQTADLDAKPQDSRPVPSRGRKITLRYTAEDFADIHETTTGEGVYEFAVRMTSDMRRFGVSRAILPDPNRTERKEEWLAAARHAATMGFEVRIEIDPASTDSNASDPQPPTAPKVLFADQAAVLKTGILGRVEELAGLRSATDSKVISGVFLALAPPASLPAGWEAGLNETTFSEFLKETGLEQDWNVQGKPDADSRLEYVKSRGLMPWLTWRSRRVATFYESVGSEIGQRHGLELTVAAPHPGNVEAQSLYEEAERIGSSPIFAWRWMAFEPDLWRNTEAIRLIGAEPVSKAHPNRDWATHPDLQVALGPQATKGHWFAGRRGHVSGESPNLSVDRNEYDLLLSAMIGHLSRHDSTSLIVDRSALGDRHQEFATWVARYEGLPETGRKAWETVAPKPGLTMRSYSTENSELLVPINPLPCPVGLELALIRRETGTSEPLDPDSDLKLVLESTGADRAVARLSIPPMHIGRLDLGGYRIESYRAVLPEESRDVVRTRYDALIRQSTGTVTANGESTKTPLTEAETKTRGRRLMAALQAYRDMRLADFFRISDGMTADRRSRRNSEIPSDMGRADLPKRRLIR